MRCVMYSEETIYLHCYMKEEEIVEPKPETRYQLFVCHSDAYTQAYECWNKFFNQTSHEADFLCHLARHL